MRFFVPGCVTGPDYLLVDSRRRFSASATIYAGFLLDPSGYSSVHISYNNLKRIFFYQNRRNQRSRHGCPPRADSGPEPGSKPLSLFRRLFATSTMPRILPLKKVKYGAPGADRFKVSKKTALFPRNDRQEELKHPEFQAENALTEGPAGLRQDLPIKLQFRAEAEKSYSSPARRFLPSPMPPPCCAPGCGAVFPVDLRMN